MVVCTRTAYLSPMQNAGRGGVQPEPHTSAPCRMLAKVVCTQNHIPGRMDKDGNHGCSLASQHSQNGGLLVQWETLLQKGEQLRKASEEVDLWPPYVHSIGEQLPPHEHT